MVLENWGIARSGQDFVAGLFAANAGLQLSAFQIRNSRLFRSDEVSVKHLRSFKVLSNQGVRQRISPRLREKAKELTASKPLHQIDFLTAFQTHGYTPAVFE